MSGELRKGQTGDKDVEAINLFLVVKIMIGARGENMLTLKNKGTQHS